MILLHFLMQRAFYSYDFTFVRVQFVTEVRSFNSFGMMNIRRDTMEQIAVRQLVNIDDVVRVIQRIDALIV